MQIEFWVWNVVTLVEKAHEEINEKEAEDLQKEVSKGKFTLNDYSKQLSQISKMIWYRWTFKIFTWTQRN